MKTRLVIICSAVSACLVATASATDLRVGLAGGYALPQAGLEGGLTLGAGPAYGVRIWIRPIRLLEIELGGDYHKLKGLRSLAEGTVTPIRGGVNLRMDFGRFTVSYGGGIGYYVFKANAFGQVLHSISEEEYEWRDAWGKVDLSAPGFYFGVALSATLGRWGVDLMPRLNYILNGGQYCGDAFSPYEGETLDYGLSDCSYPEVTLGVSYRVF